MAANDPLLAAPPKQHVPALRAWAPLASRLLGLGAQAGAAAAGGLHGAVVLRCERVGGLAELRSQAAVQPGVWCAGTGPSDPQPSDEDRALYTAGELACLLEGQRGVVLLQLHVGWDDHDAIPPYGPYKPLVLRLLREALARPDVVSFASLAPVPGAPGGSASAGLTMVLSADKEPFRSWSAHLAGFGCQAALEAQSPYYKLLVGRVLGYLPANIAHHIKLKHGSEPSREVVAAVDQALAKLSSKQPRLPWNASARGGGRKKAK
ncbi:hypothetical protein GPECTOR_6g688 [Gonium pectorale]|uniref:Uncharacterized protein n=1 Tax=Gonium pectorale TaxID=33097 RepID=A0A150GWM2_GONPE|nr:hypothetical protein GPECTOR_6g688 [Gonium pectorale]|eukprot:KXZ53770.1 hypothetical protein GPECTOR_6g688 [Gonium pectorale]